MRVSFISKHDMEFKLVVVQEYLKDGGKKRIAMRYEINGNDLMKWVSAYQLHGLPTIQQRARTDQVQL